jgi:two-component system NarL family response regulator
LNEFGWLPIVAVSATAFGLSIQLTLPKSVQFRIMSRPERIRVLVVDDHPVVCRGLTAIIQAEEGMLVVGQASDGWQAVRMFREHTPDITLMDLRMPVMSGVEAIRAIHAEFSSARFIVLTTYHGDEDIHRALKAGAQAYLLKGMSDTELLEAIRNVHSGLKYLPQPVLESLASRPPKSDLSERELQILHLIVKGMSNKRIGDSLGITEATVKWHVNMILSRLNVSDRTQAAVTALNRGIVEL